MKLIKNTSLAFLLVLLLAVIFRGYMYRQFITYKSHGQRIGYIADDDLCKYIDEQTEGVKPTNIEDIITLSLQLTSEKLNYTFDKNDIDPNKLLTSKNAHCEGYSAFFSATCNYMIVKYDPSGTWVSKPLKGEIYFCGINIHPYFNSSFFRDHDFNSIVNAKTNKKYFVDPTINDYFKIDFVSSR